MQLKKQIYRRNAFHYRYESHISTAKLTSAPTMFLNITISNISVEAIESRLRILTLSLSPESHNVQC